MDVAKIITIIKGRRDEFLDRQVGATADEPLEYSTAGLNRAIADEYDSLLQEIMGEGSEH